MPKSEDCLPASCLGLSLGRKSLKHQGSLGQAYLLASCLFNLPRQDSQSHE